MSEAPEDTSQEAPAEADWMLDLFETDPYLFALLVIGFWLSICFLLSLLGGWNALANNYSNAEPITGVKRRYQSLSMGYVDIFLVNYSAIVTLRANGADLVISVWMLFRFGHPSLRIPLMELSGRIRRVMFFKIVELTAAQNPSVKIHISREQADWLEREARTAWQYQRR